MDQKGGEETTSLPGVERDGSQQATPCEPTNQQVSPDQVDELLDSLEVLGGERLPKPILSFLIHDEALALDTATQLKASLYTPILLSELIIDTGSPISLVNPDFLDKAFPGVQRCHVPTTRCLRGVGEGPRIDTYVTLDIVLRDDRGQPWAGSAVAFLAEGLPCDLLVGTSFLKKHGLDIVWGRGREPDYLRPRGSNRQIPAWSARAQRQSQPRVATLRAAENVTIPEGCGFNVRIKHRPLPPRRHGYMVNPTPVAKMAVGSYGSVMAAIVTGHEAHVPFANLGHGPMRIREGQVLGTLEATAMMEDPAAYIAQPNEPTTLDDVLGHVEREDDEEDPKQPDGYPFNLPTPDPEVDLDEADVSEHWGPKYTELIRGILRKHQRLFRAQLGRFNDGVRMPIPFLPNATLDDLKQKAYPLSRRDREAMDGILDPLREIGVVEDVPLGRPSPSSSPAFIVWRNGKPRVVIDLRRINTKLIKDAYPLPRQDDILTSLHGSSVFSVMDVTKGFFQQEIEPEDRWKTAFVTPHRGHEQLTVSSMGLANSPGFFQHRMQKLLSRYLWKFVLVYIDDIIIFSRSIDDHCRHLDIILGVLERSGCTISLPKCHFAQPGLKALGHFVSRLGLSTLEEKTRALRDIRIETLNDLEHALGLATYYRSFVPRFSILARPLFEIKRLGFKDAPSKNPERAVVGRQTLPPAVKEPPTTDTEAHTEWQQETQRRADLWRRALQAWDRIIQHLEEAVDLAFPDYTKPFVLHVDGSRKGFGAALYQKQDGRLRPILFLSKALTKSETRYWATELETGALVWALRKLAHFLDHSKITVFTDHSAIKSAFEKGGAPRGRGRLIGWKLFLDKYRDQITLFHRKGREHTDADALSRLPPKTDETRDTAVDPLGQGHGTIVRTFVVTRAMTQRTDGAGEKREDEPQDSAGHEVQDEPSDEPAEGSSGARRGTSDQGQPNVGRIKTSGGSRPGRRRRRAARHLRERGHRVHGKHAKRDAEFLDVPLQLAATEIDGRWETRLTLSTHFTKSLAQGLAKDRTFRKIYARAKETPPDAQGTRRVARFFIRDDLLYFDDDEPRLCVPEKHLQAFLHAAHDGHAHFGTRRTLDRLRTFVFARNLSRVVASYVAACPSCVMAKTRQRHPPELVPIDTPKAPFATWCADWIVGLPETEEGYNCIWLLVDKTSKFVMGIPGRSDYTMKDWAKAYFERVYPVCGLPRALVSDQDPKLTSEFWQELCALAGLRLILTAAHHSSANGQAEVSVQTIVDALASCIGGRWDTGIWKEYLPHVLYSYNTTTHATTGLTPYEVVYTMTAPSWRDWHQGPTGPQPGPDAERVATVRREAWEATQIAVARAKADFDKSATAEPEIGGLAYVRLAKPGHRGYHLNSQTKLSFRLAGPFPVERRIHQRRYRLKLPNYLSWNPDIDVSHLVPVRTDPWGRPQPEPGTLSGDKYIIDRILDYNPRTKRYLVRWLGYDKPTWEDAGILREDVPELLEQFRSSGGRGGRL